MGTSNIFTRTMWQLAAATFMDILLVKQQVLTHAKNSIQVVRDVQWASEFKPIFSTVNVLPTSITKFN